MALIVEYHVVADMYPVSSSAIKAGMIVTLNSDGQVVPAPTSTSSPKVTAIGIAGDSSLDSAALTTAYSAEVVIGANGAGKRWTENRVSDFYDETAASQKITVYNGGGKFWISEDLFDAAASVHPGTALGISGTTAGEWEESTVVDDDICAVAVGHNTAYASGVPGTSTTTTTQTSISLGNYVPLILRL